MEMTVEAVLPKDETLYAYLEEDVGLYQRIWRRAFEDINSRSFKEKFISIPEYTKFIKKHYEILTRTANSIVRDAAGRHKALVALKKEERKTLSVKIESYSRFVERLKERVGQLKEKARTHVITPKEANELREGKFKLHNARCRLDRMERKLGKLEESIVSGHVPMTFGGKKLFSAQFHLEESGYPSFKNWKEDFEQAINHNILYIGRIDEKRGNQIVQLTPEEDGSFSLKLSKDLPFRDGEKEINVAGIKIRYGSEILRLYLNAKTKKEGKRPITYRFKKRKNGRWYIQIIFNTDSVEPQTDINRGVLAVDYNDGFLAVAELNESGNIVSLKRIDLTHHGTGGRAKAEIRDVCKGIAHRAGELKKPLAAEKLDFKRKKAYLHKRGGGEKYKRIIHQFDYSRFMETLERACEREAVETRFVNPAYTTQIGKEKYAESRKLNVHFSAALVIGRRAMGYRDSLKK